MATKKRGGQPGNTNALKHGYYSKRVVKSSIIEPPPDDLDLSLYTNKTLDTEIKVMKYLFNKYAQIAVLAENAIDLAAYLNVCGLAAARIAGLLKVNLALDLVNTEYGQWAQGLNDALEYWNNQFGLDFGVSEKQMTPEDFFKEYLDPERYFTSKL